jgi:NitT/TauT family transport system substrate-binding protein
MKTTKTMTVVALLSVTMIVLGGCGSPSAPDEATAPERVDGGDEPLKITINSWIGWAPLYLAKEKGLYGNVGVEIIRVEDTGARKSTMISGQVDGYGSSVDNFALDSALGVPGKIVLAFDESFGGDGIVVKQDIATIEDLKNRQVGYQTGLPSHFLLLTVLNKAGLTQDDITHVDMDADKAGAAFAAGHLDAAVTWEPWISKAAETGQGKILITTKELPGLIVDTLVFRNDVLQDRKSDVQAVVSAWFEALEYWNNHKDESDAIMAEAFNLDVPTFRDMYSGVRFFDLTRNLEYFGSNNSGQIYEVFREASALWKEAGVISEETDPAVSIDGTFLSNN